MQFAVNDMCAADAAVPDNDHAEIRAIPHDPKEMFALYQGIGVVFDKNRNIQAFFQWRNNIDIAPFQNG